MKDIPMPEKGISPNLQEIYFESASRGLHGDTTPRCGLKKPENGPSNCGTCWKLTKNHIRTMSQWHCSAVSIVNFEQVNAGWFAYHNSFDICHRHIIWDKELKGLRSRKIIDTNYYSHSSLTYNKNSCR